MTRNAILALTILFGPTHVDAAEPGRASSRDQYLQGYAESVSGEILAYWNFHPLAKRSLLTRCTTGEMEIVWKTQPLPPAGTSDTLAFLWIGAYSTGTSIADHEFDFYLNGEKSLTFRTLMGGHYDDWSIAGRGGVVLRYRHVWTDHVNDAHGYFILKVPAASYPSTAPLTIKVVGRGEDSRDWYMTFMHAFRDSAVIRPLPMVIRRGSQLQQPVEIGIDSPAGQGTVSIGVDGESVVAHPLQLGWNSVILTIPAVKEARVVPLEISINEGPVLSRGARVTPVRHRTLWLLPHSHNDIGYSDLQTAVLDIQIKNIRSALRLIEATRKYPEGSRFKWNIEILWPVEAFLAGADPRERDEFVRAVRNGDIGLNAFYVNPLTGIARPEALIRLTDYSRELERRYGLDIPVAMVSDIPGFTWSVVPALAQAGVRFFTSGPNSGDRIGHFTEALGDRPFYWVGPSGKDSVLFWVAGTGYSLFHATRTISTNRKFRQQLQEYLEHLDSADYPFDIVQMRYSVYSDNGMTDSTLSDFVQDWNASYVSPAIHIGTTEEMFVAFEKEHASALPSMAGDITPYWEDGAASTAAELGMAERSTERLVQAEILSSLCAPGAFDRAGFADAWEAINLWIEHTWGAWNSVSDPDHPDAQAQWRIKQGFALEAESRSQELLHRQTQPSSSPESNLFEVINTSSWPRTDLAILSADESRAGDRVVNELGEPVPSQRLMDGRLAILARSVPPLGSLRYAVSPGPAVTISGVTIDGWKVQNHSLRVTIDSITGAARSITDRSTGDELLLGDGDGFNSLIIVSGKDPQSRSGPQGVQLRIGESGPLIASIVSESTAPGIAKAIRELSLIDGLDRIDIRNVIEKKSVRDKEAVYFGFESNMPDAVSRLDLGWGHIRPEVDQLAGSCRDFFCVQRWVDISAEKSGFTWATVEAPLVSLGTLVDERHHNDGPSGWKTSSASSSRVYSWVMNNYWHTNYKADQAGKSWFHYSLKPHRGFDPVEAYRFGVERNQPLVTRRVNRGDSRAAAPFTFQSTAIAVTTVLPAPEGHGFLVRLYNPATESSSCALGSSVGSSLQAYESSARGERGRNLPPILEMGPFEVRTVRIE